KVRTAGDPLGAGRRTEDQQQGDGHREREERGLRVAPERALLETGLVQDEGRGPHAVTGSDTRARYVESSEGGVPDRSRWSLWQAICSRSAAEGSCVSTVSRSPSRLAPATIARSHPRSTVNEIVVGIPARCASSFGVPVARMRPSARIAI